MGMKLRSVLGNSQWLDGGAMFGNAPREMWKRWHQPDELGRIKLNCRTFLLEYQQKTILLETGIGAFFEPKLAERYGIAESHHVLIEQLEALGLTHDKIDYVILSHLHFDHAGGLLAPYEDQKEGDLTLLFPNAKIVCSRVGFERSQNPHFRDRASFIPALDQKLKDSGRLILVEGESHPDVFPEVISFRYSEGHTPGQMHTCVHFGKDVFMFAGDLIPGASWVHLPITMGYDRYAEQVINEKQDLYTSMDLNHLHLLYTHDPEFASSKILLNEKKKYQATESVLDAEFEVHQS